VLSFVINCLLIDLLLIDSVHNCVNNRLGLEKERVGVDSLIQPQSVPCVVDQHLKTPLGAIICAKCSERGVLTIGRDPILLNRKP